jgi:hypothetical protein
MDKISVMLKMYGRMKFSYYKEKLYYVYKNYKIQKLVF